MSRSVEKRLEAQLGSSRNGRVLASFVAYCRANPDLRFYQALLNWSGRKGILAFVEEDGSVDTKYIEDTYGWVTKDG
jgi:hypothetical protein